MSNKLSEAPTGQDIENLEAIVSCVEAITWEFDNVTGTLRMDNAVLSERLRHSSRQNPSTATVETPAKTPQGLNPILAQELVDASAAYAQELTRWAQELEKRNRQNIAETDPITSGGDYRLPGETFKPVPMPMVTDSAIVAGTIVGAAADAVADTFLVFVSLAGPINAPYNPVDAKFGYKEAFWKMLGYDKPPIGARTEAENEQLSEAFKSAIFSLYGRDAVLDGEFPLVSEDGSVALFTKDGYIVRLNRRFGENKWELPPGWHLPANDGQWTGEPGNSFWQSNIPEVNKMTGNRAILFRNGYIYLSPYTVYSFESEELNGTDNDADKADKELAIILKLNNANAAAKWRWDNDLVWHHLEDWKTLQLVPKLLNDVPHQGGASELRQLK
jgi:hypothetical protein